jgi:hypothetical protein
MISVAALLLDSDQTGRGQSREMGTGGLRHNPRHASKLPAVSARPSIRASSIAARGGSPR